jgi:uncharacterized integral membrane protein
VFKRLIRWVRLALLTCVIAVFLMFAVNNHGNIPVSLFPLPYEASMPLFLLLILSFCFGMVIGAAFLSVRTLRLRRMLHHSHHRAQALENELEGRRAREQQASGLPVSVA